MRDGMGKLNKYYPYEYAKSAYDIDYKKLYDKGYRGIIFDIDNTLVHHGDDADENVEKLFEELKKIGLDTVLLSDNDDERVKRFNEKIGSKYICDADKPNPEAFLMALKMLSVEKNEAAVIGDRMFKDILGANNAEIPSIMVKFIDDGSKWLGWGRYLEFVLLFLWRHSKYYERMGGISMSDGKSFTKNFKRFLKHEIMFGDINSTCYDIAVKKEIFKRHVKNMTGHEKFLKEKNTKPLPVLIYRSESGLIKRGKDIDPETQYGKAENIAIASDKLNGSIIKPGETFSFWKLVGPITESRGYKKGRVIQQGKLIADFGGGLCNLGNTLHLLALHSPLDVTEAHYHSDALAPDHGERVPMSSGTSVNYNFVDVRFKNNTDQNFQILAWVENETLIAEIRCEHEVGYDYKITEDDHRFVKQNGKYFRLSKIYRDVVDKKTGKTVSRKLIRDNHSQVMFDYDLIPKELIKDK